MWFDVPQRPNDWRKAERHLKASDPRLARVINAVGPCTLTPRRDNFVVLCKAIFTQQISTAVATVLFSRFRNLFPMRRPTPQRVVDVLNGDESRLKSVGLSRQKRAYLLDLAEKFAAGHIPTRSFARMDDERIIESLTQVKGVGRWTAEMFLIFVLNRPDVLPVDDLGLQKGVQMLNGWREMPTKQQVADACAAWHPWRTVGTWYMWRGWDELLKLSNGQKEGARGK
jgi:DNA-3-methyladenine glycosylase II